MPSFGLPPVSNQGTSNSENPDARFAQLESTLEQFQVGLSSLILIHFFFIGKCSSYRCYR